MAWRIPKSRLAKQAAILLATIVLPISGYAAIVMARNNFHEVVPHELYRSAQPSDVDLAELKATIGLRTVINLRGANPTARWYQAEVRESARLGITLIDFRMKASRGLTLQQATALIDLMRKADKPVLIH